MRVEMIKAAQRRWKPVIEELVERLYVPENFETGRVLTRRPVQLSFALKGKPNLELTVARGTEVFFYPEGEFNKKSRKRQSNYFMFIVGSWQLVCRHGEWDLTETARQYSGVGRRHALLGESA